MLQHGKDWQRMRVEKIFGLPYAKVITPLQFSQKVDAQQSLPQKKKTAAPEIFNINALVTGNNCWASTFWENRSGVMTLTWGRPIIYSTRFISSKLYIILQHSFSGEWWESLQNRRRSFSDPVRWCAKYLVESILQYVLPFINASVIIPPRKAGGQRCISKEFIRRWWILRLGLFLLRITAWGSQLTLRSCSQSLDWTRLRSKVPLPN